jgi:YbbR domain-containing protein
MRWFDRDSLLAAWRTARVAVLDPDRLRRLFTHNAALKLLSLGIAFSLWFFVNFGERDTEETMKIPLELRNIPAHLMITSPRVDFIDLRVTGPRTLLGRIDRNRLAIGLDLSGVRPGPAVFRVDADSLNLPRGVRVVRINPAQVTLEMERVGHKSVPVHLHITGKPPPDLQVAETKISPETVQVAGPASDVEDIQSVSTEPLDMHTASAGILERELTLEAPGEYMSLSANRAAVQVRIEEVEVSRELKRVEVAVRNADLEHRVIPDHVRLTVRGPKHLIGNLEMAQGAVYIDAQGADVGEHVAKPTVDVPTGIELVSVDPPQVKLILWKAKRASRGR